MLDGGTPSPSNVPISAIAASTTCSVAPDILSRTDPVPSSTPAVSISVTVRAIVPASLATMAEIALLLATNAEVPDARSACKCAAVSLTAIWSGTTLAPKTRAISANCTSVTTNVAPVMSDNAGSAPSITPAYSACAAVSTIVPLGVTAMSEIWARWARIAEDAPAWRSAARCAAVSTRA